MQNRRNGPTASAALLRRHSFTQNAQRLKIQSHCKVQHSNKILFVCFIVTIWATYKSRDESCGISTGSQLKCLWLGIFPYDLLFSVCLSFSVFKPLFNHRFTFSPNTLQFKMSFSIIYTAMTLTAGFDCIYTHLLIFQQSSCFPPQPIIIFLRPHYTFKIDRFQFISIQFILLSLHSSVHPSVSPSRK